VGTAVCSSCHANVAKAHRGSDHDRAIEIPARDTVLAPFAGETFAHDGVTTTFSQSGGDYFVKTRGVDGKLQSFRVAYTFGYRPLQQYLLDFGDGRLQAFTVAWDARPPGQGGQRYFSLYPGERLVPSDELHWTRFTQNWNFTCADCHSTEFKKGYDQAKDTFASNFVELDVGCEACHGPGSHHLSWTADAKAAEADPTKGLVIQLERAAAWTIPPGARSAIPRSVGDNLHELETCAPCHARRQQLREGRRVNEPFLDAYLPDLLISPLYQHDGQVDDEVYIYGSFLQSRMFHAGVRCSDCHDSHSLKLRRPGNALCTGCHDAGTFDSVAHHHHPGKRGGECVSCHMPQKTYMQVDPRHDHSIRIPRPDLGPRLGTTDPCTGCHEDRTQAWAAGRISDWFGPTRRDHYGAALHAAQLREPGAEASLIELTQKSSVPAIVRATALLLLQNYPTATSRAALHVGARSEESLLRLGAAEGARGLAPGQRLEVILRLLTDPLLAVRTAAARTIADVPPSQFPSSTQATIKRTVEELRKTERYNADRPDAWLRVALIDAGRGDLDQAVRSLEQALKLDARFVPALVNLADVRRLQQNETEAETLLRRALGVDPLHAEAWHALGLSLVRQKRTAEGVSMLKRAFELRPQNARLAYVYAVALGDGGDIAAAIRVLRRSLEQHPHDPTLIQTLMNYAQKAGDAGLTQEMAARLVALRAAQAGAVQ
jgi:predicted CXXCH cytochrome family protein